jgi:hypothetical protein
VIPSIAEQLMRATIPEKQPGKRRPKKPPLRDRAIDALILWGPITLVGITVHIRCGLGGLRPVVLQLEKEGLAEFKKDHNDRKQWSPTKKLLDMKRDAY